MKYTFFLPGSPSAGVTGNTNTVTSLPFVHTHVHFYILIQMDLGFVFLICLTLYRGKLSNLQILTLPFSSTKEIKNSGYHISRNFCSFYPFQLWCVQTWLLVVVQKLFNFLLAVIISGAVTFIEWVCARPIDTLLHLLKQCYVLFLAYDYYLNYNTVTIH